MWFGRKSEKQQWGPLKKSSADRVWVKTEVSYSEGKSDTGEASPKYKKVLGQAHQFITYILLLMCMQEEYMTKI